MDMERYVTFSLELHLFFARIMKEHALFLKAGFTPANQDFIREAEFYKREFEKLLRRAVLLSDNVIGKCVLSSGEILTEFTADAEKQTQCFTGIPIDMEITRMESRLRCSDAACISSDLCRQVKQLNQTALRLLGGFIDFKEKILNRMVHCCMFTMNYPLLIEHILREAKLYQTFICNMERGDHPDDSSIRETELFWNQIMMEHALFIRGLLDPSEEELVKASHSFAQQYKTLLARARSANDATMTCQESLHETLKFREFKTAGVKGIENCEIRSIILPLLADHVLREANHYIRLLKSK